MSLHFHHAVRPGPIHHLCALACQPRGIKAVVVAVHGDMPVLRSVPNTATRVRDGEPARGAEPGWRTSDPISLVRAARPAGGKLGVDLHEIGAETIARIGARAVLGTDA